MCASRRAWPGHPRLCPLQHRQSWMARSIGIGGHLTMPPLPHHRAYGSVSRRFGGLSARQRLHGKQSKTFEALVGEGPMQCARRTQSPWSLRTEDGCPGHLLRDIQVTKFFVASAARLPLDPNDTTQASPYPAIQRCQLVHLAKAEVSAPSPQKRFQVGDHPIQAHPAVSLYQVTSLVLEPGHGLDGNA